MPFLKYIEDCLNNPLTIGARSVVSLIISPIIFVLGMQKYTQNDWIMPIWERDTSNLFHWLTNLGHTNIAGVELPTGIVGFIAALIVLFLALKSLAKYPEKICLHLLGLLILDYLVISTLVNIFFFSGSGSELVFYIGSFIAGVYFFGERITSQIALLALIGLIIIRMVYVDSLYLYVFWIPLLSMVYVVLRAPLESESYRDDLKGFSFGNLFGRGSL